MIIHPIILSGGSGTRLWPLSREHYPKQLLPLYGQETLLQQTIMRIGNLKGAKPPIVVCNEEHRFLISEQLLEIGVKPASLILEPVGRNTAPALTLAALSLPEEDRKTVLLVMPADHVIRDNDAFLAAVSVGASMAEQGYLTTFGIAPTAPETGYGYIKVGKALPLSPMPGSASNESPITNHEITAFVEKPDQATAESYLNNGGYLWNSGIFMMLASVWLAELERLRPDILAACTNAYSQGSRDSDFYRVGKDAFLRCPADSIDYAVMEKTDRAAVVPLDAGWSDIGAWSALWEISTQDERGNVLQGDVFAHATQNALVIAQHRFVATVGVDNLVVIETPDAVLVMHKDQAQHVREVVKRLKSDNRPEYHTHRRVHRPWGYYEGVDAGHRFQVKRLTIKPGAALSLQLHHQRAEHWVVVKGQARVTRGDEVFELTENQSTYIPIGTKHRLENIGDAPLEIIEVQSGSYLGEDDIVRFEDIYNRHV